MFVDSGGGSGGGLSSADRAAMLEAARRRMIEEQQRRAAEQAAREAAQRQAAAQARRLEEQMSVNGTDRLNGAGESMDLGQEPWKTEQPKLPENVTLERVRNEPELRQELKDLQESDDPIVQDYLADTARSLQEQSLVENMATFNGDYAFDAHATDVQEIAKLTGLGSQIEATAQEAVQNVATDLLATGVCAADVSANPAKGQLLASLADHPDAAVQEQLKSTVEGWATEALDYRLEGASGEGETKEALEFFKDEMRTLAQETGLGTLIQDSAESLLKDRKGTIEDKMNEGKNMFQRAWDGLTDFLGDVVGGIADVGGDIIAGGTNIAAGVIEKVGEFGGKAVDAGLDAQGQLFGAGLDLVGAHGAADTVRGAYDKAGDVAETVIAGTTGFVGNTTRTAGQVADGALDVVGTIADEGVFGAATQLADQVLGPEKPEHMGEIDGYTGLITNRLGEGDSVYLNMEVSGKLGVGAFAGAELNGTAMLSRTNDGQIALTMAVGAKVEAGVSARTGFEAGSVEASADASASVTAGAAGKVTMVFDPNNPDDVSRLQALMEPNTGRLVNAAATMNPLALAAPSPQAINDALTHNYASHETNFNAGLKVGAGAEVEMGALQARLGLDASGVAGQTVKHNADGTTETKFYLSGSAGITASGSVGERGHSVNARGTYMEALTVTTDANGEIIGMEADENVAAQFGDSGSRKKSGERAEDGTKSSRETTMGRVERTVQKVERELTPEGVAEAVRLMNQQDMSSQDAFEAVVNQEGMSNNYLSTTESDEFTIGGKIGGGVAGVQFSVGARATVGKAHTESDRLTLQDLEDLNLITGRS